MASKLARTSQTSLLSRRPPSLVSSSSSRQIPDNTSMGSFSPAGLGLPMFGAQVSDPVLMRLNILEDMMRRTHEEGLRRLEEIRQLYEAQVEKKS